MYNRKTHDEYDLMGDYGNGYERILTEDTYAEAKKRKQEYIECEYCLLGVKIVKRRVRNETHSG